MSYIARFLLLLCLGTGHAYAVSDFTFQHYDEKRNRLLMHLVTSTTQGDVLLQVGEKMQQLQGARLEGLFMLSIPVSCENLSVGSTLHWITERGVQKAHIPPQSCRAVPERQPITIFNKGGECWLNVGENTLWRAATEVSKLNKATVYQNMYAMFLANRQAFSGEDINRLQSTLLRCPPDQLIERISPEDALRLFKEMLEFKKQS